MLPKGVAPNFGAEPYLPVLLLYPQAVQPLPLVAGGGMAYMWWATGWGMEVM